jgi:uncharacterized membrane protein
MVGTSPRLGPADRRALVGSAAAAAGLATAVGAGASWSVAVLAAWDAAALTFLGLVWPAIATKDASATADHAQVEDGPRRLSESVLLGAGTASLIAVAFTLARAGRTHDGARAGLTLLAVASVTLAWACVHTVYTLRYARLYFVQPLGGIAFPEDDPPVYLDFAYVALRSG